MADIKLYTLLYLKKINSTSKNNDFKLTWTWEVIKNMFGDLLKITINNIIKLNIDNKWLLDDETIEI